MELFFSDEAEEDIINITEYTIKEWGYRQADKYNLAIESTFQEILKNPHHILSKTRNDLMQNLRCINVEKHAIFYRLMNNNSAIEILRILHLSMDFKRHF